MQVTVEIRVEPKTRADRAIGVRIRRSLSAPEHPPRTVRLDGRIDQRVAGETAPMLEVGAEIRVATNDGQEIARATSAQYSNKLGQQTGGKRFDASAQLDVRFAPRTLGESEPWPAKGEIDQFHVQGATIGVGLHGAINRGRKAPACVAEG
jgi:hypothetical protein